MKRVACPERDDWKATAEAAGFNFHTIGGERYWDVRAYYAFELEEIERCIERATTEIDALCIELVNRAVDDERYLKRLKIPEAFWSFIAESWGRHGASLYGRLDLSFGAGGPAKLLEYNADTPTSIFEAAVFQWTWLEQAIERRFMPGDADQFNSIHERLIDAWSRVAAGHHVHFTGITENAEDVGTLIYLEDVAQQAGVETTLLGIEELGLGAVGAWWTVTLVRSRWHLSSTRGNGFSTMRSEQNCRSSLLAGLNRRGKLSFPIKEFSLSFGRCFRVTKIYCRHILKMIQKWRNLTEPMFASRSFLGRGPMFHWSKQD